jgi:hypothetical protein
MTDCEGYWDMDDMLLFYFEDVGSEGQSSEIFLTHYSPCKHLEARNFAPKEVWALSGMQK